MLSPRVLLPLAGRRATRPRNPTPILPGNIQPTLQAGRLQVSHYFNLLINVIVIFTVIFQSYFGVLSIIYSRRLMITNVFSALTRLPSPHPSLAAPWLGDPLHPPRPHPSLPPPPPPPPQPPLHTVGSRRLIIP